MSFSVWTRTRTLSSGRTANPVSGPFSIFLMMTMMKKKSKKVINKRISEGINQEDIFTICPPDFWPADILDKLPAYSVKRDFLNAQTDACIQLDIASMNFRETKNPIMIIRALSISHKIGFYPPMWAYNALMEIFKRYEDSQGRADLNKLFGFTIGHGGDSYFKEALIARRDAFLSLNIFRLTLLGFIIPEAVEMVYNHPANAKGWKEGEIIIDPLRKSYIKKMWDTKWSKEFNEKSDNAKWYKEYQLKWVKENKEKLLKQFPPVSYRKKQP